VTDYFIFPVLYFLLFFFRCEFFPSFKRSVFCAASFATRGVCAWGQFRTASDEKTEKKKTSNSLQSTFCMVVKQKLYFIKVSNNKKRTHYS